MKTYRYPDGITIRILRTDYDKCINVTEQLMKETKMSYESVIYSKMVIQDVNNYLAQYESGDCKHKGLFEIDKDLHKDPSMRIVPIALKEYFLNNVPILTTLKNHQNIYDFCLRLRLNKGWEGLYKYIDFERNEIVTKKLSRTTRYFISNHGGSIYKKSTNDDRITGVNVGFITTEFNTYIQKNINEYDINYNFYLIECNKIINSIKDNQLTLF